MKTKHSFLILLSGVLFFLMPLNGSSQTILWERTFPPPATPYCHRDNYGMGGESIAFDVDSNVVILGRFKIGGDSCIGQANNSVIRLLKLNPNGDTLWTRIFMEQLIVQNIGAELSGFSIKRSSDNNFIIAGYSQIASDTAKAVLIKIDTSGNIIWKKKYFDRYLNYLEDVFETVNHELIACGRSSEGASNNQMIYVLKTDSSGNELWHRTYGMGWFGEGYSIVYNTSIGNYTVMGCIIPSTPNWGWRYKYVAININGNDGSEISRYLYGDTTKNSKCYGGILTNDNGYLMVGTENYIAIGAKLLVVKSDMSGNVQWSYRFGVGDSTSCYIYPTDVMQTTDSGYIVTGNKAIIHLNPPSSIDTTEFFLIKINKNGNQDWEKVWRLDKNSYMSSIKEYYDHGFIVTGYTHNSALTTMECYVARFDSLSTIYNPTSFDEIDSFLRVENISLSPNPATNEIRVQSADFKVESVEIYDVLGERCLTPALSQGEGVRVDVSALSAGIYFVKVKGEKEERVSKFVKQ
ncbi:MAG TPA: T9SS type A sorting domain-containing protein [Bacteroidia bacterium]|nr:T9SS type A sorting domain-containing protein [Bacteroidia bacterium]